VMNIPILTYVCKGPVTKLIFLLHHLRILCSIYPFYSLRRDEDENKRKLRYYYRSHYIAMPRRTLEPWLVSTDMFRSKSARVPVGITTNDTLTPGGGSDMTTNRKTYRLKAMLEMEVPHF
ncbi:hypothetical protein L9F63_013069, partial [Diploptera punctata]